ncbi:MAG: hypothetical protein AAF609_23265 [Cyanobacteria bacterium P01_C01_bin.120]
MLKVLGLLKAVRGVKALSEKQKASIRATAYERLKAIAAVKSECTWEYSAGRGGIFVHYSDGKGQLFATDFPKKEDFETLLKPQYYDSSDWNIVNNEVAPERYELDGVRVTWPITCNVKYRDGELLIDLGAVSA